MKAWINRMGAFPILLFCTDLIFLFVTWLVSPPAIQSVGLFILLFSLILLAAAVGLKQRGMRRMAKAIESFLETPDETNKAELLRAAGGEWEGAVDLLYEKLTSQAAQINEGKMALSSYREYIEAWVHEIKTPLSLSTLVLNNRKEEMSPSVYDRMIHVQHQLNENVDRILYYARLQTDHPDYRFEEFRLDACVKEAVREYAALAGENQISVTLDLPPLTVVSDQKVLRFMFSQLLSNAYKYADPGNGRVEISSWRSGDKIYLAVRNNGSGVPPEDAPFLFDKGFTGSHPDRQKATGMGLYLVRKYADDLCIDVALEPVCTTGDGFGIEFVFSL